MYMKAVPMRCPLCMEPMRDGENSCSFCSYFSSFSSGWNILPLTPSPDVPFYGGAQLRSTYFGSVYLGYSTRMKRKVVLKQYEPFPMLLKKAGGFEPHPGDEDAFRRASETLEAEASALSKIFIPGTEHVYGSFRARGTVYQVAEYIPGFDMSQITIFDLMKIKPELFPANKLEKKYPSLALYRLFRPILLALREMHSIGIYHRNIEASSILFDTEHPRLVLANLGTKEAHSCHNTISSAIEFFNDFCPHFRGAMTPAQEDIYAICNVFYHLMTGTLLPWHCKKPADIPSPPIPQAVLNVLEMGSPDPFPDGFNVPMPRIPAFSGMDQLIAQMDAAFEYLALQENQSNQR